MPDKVATLMRAKPGTIWVSGERDEYGARTWYIKTTEPATFANLHTGELTLISQIATPIERGNWAMFYEE